jgi:glucokinase
LRHQSGLTDGVALPSLATLTIPSLIAAASDGNSLVLEVIAEAGTYLGIAIANVINLMNPSLVVIGGSIARFGEPLFEAIRVEVRKRALWDALSGVSIVPSTLGDDAGTVGAAALFLNQLSLESLLHN